MKITNLTEPMPEKIKLYQVTQWPVWMLAFRPCFLAAGILAVFSMAYWLFVLSGLATWHLSIPATLWHAHEMVFGFAGVVVVGFLLTAAQTWTNVPSISGAKLMALTMLWVAARVVFFIDIDSSLRIDLNIYCVAILQLLWWLAAIIALSNMLIKASSTQNYIFIIMLSMLCALNSIYLTLVAMQKMLLALAVVDTGVLVITIVVGIVAGRVIPFFTARGLQLTEQVRAPKLDKWVLICSLFVLILFFLSKLFIPELTTAYAFAVLGALHVYRSRLWWHKGILKVPLLWSLHIAYLFLGLGFLLIAASFYFSLLQFKDALHLITVGTIGLMIISMMVRVSHGHTGRTLTIPCLVSVAFVIILAAAVVRALLPFVIGHHLAWQLSAVFWLVGFCLFLFHCAPILVNRRVDGRRG